jgi:acyl-homoserine-lactone acylase
VLREAGGKAYAYRVAGLDAPGMVEQYLDMARARSLREFEAAVRRLQMPMFTIVYADRDGHVMHLYNGRVPVRASGGWSFWKGTIPGESSATLWTRVHPYADLPRILDPQTGWVQNANDPPWTATLPAAIRADDYPAYFAPRDFDFRPQRSAELLMADSSISLEEMLEYRQGAHAELADRVLPDLLAAARAGGDTLLLRAADVLEKWDRAMEPESRGAVLFYAWSQGFWESVPRGAEPFAVPRSPAEPVTTPRGLADPAAAAATLRAAAARVQRQAGALDAPWGAVFRLRRDRVDLPARGGPDELGIFPALWFRQAADGRFAATGGDSYIAAVEFTTPVRARTLLPYGNASQPGSPHRVDQLPLFARGETRPVWRTRAEVEANLASRELLR